MGDWKRVQPIAVGGLVAVAFLDDDTIAVGSHSGLGIIDTQTGTVLARQGDRDGSYFWYHDDPPSISIEAPGEVVLCPAMGLWGGALPTQTHDGWTVALDPRGASLTHTSGTTFLIEDDEDYVAHGFSPNDRLFVFATASTLHVLHR